MLTKSKYISGIQCLKYLWFLVNAPDSVPPFDESARFRFQQGHEVGELAKKLFPGGIELEHGSDIKKELLTAQRLTGLFKNGNEEELNNSFIKPGENLAGAGVPLFEPAFSYKNTFARPDILVPAASGFWDIVEVKSATAIKEINIHDMAFQRYCYEGAGLKINSCYLLYINKNYIKKTNEIDPHEFFIMEDITERVSLLMPDVENNISIMEEVADSKICPDIKISKNCFNPYDCPLKEICWEFLPEGNVFELYRGKELAFSLLDRGILEISQIKETEILNPVQKKQHIAADKKQIIIDKNNIEAFLNKLKYPLYFLDFETFATAIPKYIGTKPYQNIPFQFSCNKIQSVNSQKQKDFYFLADDACEDPRQKFLKSLKKALGYFTINTETEEPDAYPEGTILVYYESFEKNILQELATAFPEESSWIDHAISRIIDLYEPFGKFHYYNPKQKGSASLKRVLPAVTGVGYDNLDISNGQEASLRFIEIAFNSCRKNKVEEERVSGIRKALLDYCGLDTQGMIFILKELYRLVKE